MKLNNKIIKHLNDTLAKKGAKWSYKLKNETTFAPMAECTILDSTGWLTRCTINCNEDYEKWLIEWFMENYGITLCFNNTHTSFWSSDMK